VGQEIITSIYVIMQSKIMRRKFLQLEGPDRKYLPYPVIGGGVVSKAIKEEKVLIEKPKPILEVYVQVQPTNNNNNQE
jgi:hypothetical protein